MGRRLRTIGDMPAVIGLWSVKQVNRKWQVGTRGICPRFNEITDLGLPNPTQEDRITPAIANVRAIIKRIGYKLKPRKAPKGHPDNTGFDIVK